MLAYPPLNVTVTTPRLELRGATDALLEELAVLVRAGQVDAEPPPYDDPTSFYENDPDLRVQKWLQAIWRNRGRVTPELWRLNLAVVIDGQAVGVQDIVGRNFAKYGTVTSFSWLARDFRGRGLGREMREAALHLAFDGLGASEAGSDAFVDNVGSNRISESLGYVRNGLDWDTRLGEKAQIQMWRLTREDWLHRRRDDITLSGAEPCLRTFQATT